MGGLVGDDQLLEEFSRLRRRLRTYLVLDVAANATDGMCECAVVG